MVSVLQILETESEAETASFASLFSQSLKMGDIVLLYGDLGAGKSVFSRALIRAVCGDKDIEVPSPTFTLVQTYDADAGGKVGTVWHFDLYRLSDQSEIYEIGWEEALDGGLMLVEWPERLGGLKPQRRYEIYINVLEGCVDGRRIEVKFYE